MCDCVVLQLLKEYMKPSSDWGPAEQDNRAEFIDLIMSNESIKKKCVLHVPNEDGVDDNEETSFFQSKQSIIDKLNRVATKEIMRNSSFIGSEAQLNRKNAELIVENNKVIKSACNLATIAQKT